MSDPFVTGRGTLFRGPRSVAAVVQPLDAAPFATRIIRSSPDAVVAFGGGGIVQGTNVLDFEATGDAPEAGWVVAIGGAIVDGQITGGETLELCGAAIADPIALKWRIGAEPYRP